MRKVRRVLSLTSATIMSVICVCNNITSVFSENASIYTSPTRPVSKYGLPEMFPIGDVNFDRAVNVRDCAFIAVFIANDKADSLPMEADVNRDGKKNVRDAAALSKHLARK